MKKLGFVAGPMAVVTLSQYLLQVTSVMMVGHLGELALSSTSIAISLSGVTGFSLIHSRTPGIQFYLYLKCYPSRQRRMGMSSALETLCGQAYGAQQYKKFGNQIYTAILSLLIVCIPLAIFWKYTETILIFVGQSSSISHEAGKFITYLIPALFAYAVLQPLVRYFQMQSMLLPMLASSAVALCLHIPLCWALVYKTSLGNIGAAISIGVAMWSNAIFLLFYMVYSPSCAKTRSLISVEVFYGMRQFFSFAIPSAVMICLELWSYEFIVLLSGLLPNPELETSVLAICTRVSNELGAGNPEGARVAVLAIMILTVAETVIVSTAVFASRRVFGYIFTNEKEVVNYVTKIAPFLCLNIVMDSLKGTLSGIARGVGWQRIGAYANLAAYYLFGIPVAILLGFYTSLRGEGLWIGILVGSLWKNKSHDRSRYLNYLLRLFINHHHTNIQDERLTTKPIYLAMGWEHTLSFFSAGFLDRPKILCIVLTTSELCRFIFFLARTSG
ncbi:MATE efflux family protein [Artemisia annua]|uniref:Protein DETOXIFICATION n=1 Tax=Artemisia annua TaxID=35608 RepID=A0A2U1Q7F1_ARTAN|nr:MATE efflux family protein [Artemisia annua]